MPRPILAALRDTQGGRRLAAVFFVAVGALLALFLAGVGVMLLVHPTSYYSSMSALLAFAIAVWAFDLCGLQPCLAVTHERTQTHRVPTQKKAASPRASDRPPAIRQANRVLVLGDFGDGTCGAGVLAGATAHAGVGVNDGGNLVDLDDVHRAGIGASATGDAVVGIDDGMRHGGFLSVLCTHPHALCMRVRLFLS